jgi:predicted DNA-binding WGR domain protein
MPSGSTACPSVFGSVSLARAWGRIGQLRLDPYPDQTAAAAALEALRRRKVRRGDRKAP